MPGNPLLDVNNLSDVSDAAIARENLDVDSKEEGQARVDTLSTAIYDAGWNGEANTGITDDRSKKLNIPLPVTSNRPIDDIVRIREAFVDLDGIIYVDPRSFGAHDITEEGYANYDSAPAFQAAINYASDNNIGRVVYSGSYCWLSFTQTFVAPGDDGTVYPGWVGSGDENLNAEAVNTIPCCVKIPSNIKLMANNKDSDSISGNWNISTGNIDINQGCGIIFSEGSKAATIRVQMEEISLKSFFIGYIIEGISFRSDFKNCIFTGCAIGGIEQGVEKSTRRNITLINCYAGIVRGGWWLYRSNTRQTITYIPPYPATDVFLGCWIDADTTDGFAYESTGEMWNTRYAAIDILFDTYFWKSANSAATSKGGRLSNNADPTNPAEITPFYGIASRGFIGLSRYGRYMSNNSLRNGKTFNTHRAPFYLNMGHCCPIDDLFVERSGYVDPHNRTEIFGVNVQDPLRSVGYLQPIAAEGYVPGNNINLVSCPAQSFNKPTTMGLSHSIYHGISGANNGNADDYSFPVTVTFQNTGQKVNPVKWRWDLAGNNATAQTLYLMDMNFFRVPALSFGTDLFTFDYKEDVFTPSLKVGSVSISLVTATGMYILIGDRVECFLTLETGTNLSALAGDITISGLPFARATILPAGNYAVVTMIISKSTANNIGGIMTGTDVILTKDYRQSHLSGADFPSGGQFMSLNIIYTKSRNTVTR
jgi:hypothetical protein